MCTPQRRSLCFHFKSIKCMITYYLRSSLRVYPFGRTNSLDLATQQRLRLVHLRNDSEPIRRLLHRHLMRRLVDAHQGAPVVAGDELWLALQWLLGVWRRLDEGAGRLGLGGVGPATFLGCSMKPDKPDALLR